MSDPKYLSSIFSFEANISQTGIDVAALLRRRSGERFYASSGDLLRKMIRLGGWGGARCSFPAYFCLIASAVTNWQLGLGLELPALPVWAPSGSAAPAALHEPSCSLGARGVTEQCNTKCCLPSTTSLKCNDLGKFYIGLLQVTALQWLK